MWTTPRGVPVDPEVNITTASALSAAPSLSERAPSPLVSAVKSSSATGSTPGTGGSPSGCDGDSWVPPVARGPLKVARAGRWMECHCHRSDAPAGPIGHHAVPHRPADETPPGRRARPHGPSARPLPSGPGSPHRRMRTDRRRPRPGRRGPALPTADCPGPRTVRDDQSSRPIGSLPVNTISRPAHLPAVVVPAQDVVGSGRSGGSCCPLATKAKSVLAGGFVAVHVDAGLADHVLAPQFLRLERLDQGPHLLPAPSAGPHHRRTGQSAVYSEPHSSK